MEYATAYSRVCYNKDEEAGFHATFENQPQGQTHHSLAYADYLRDNDKPTHADVVAADVETAGRNTARGFVTSSPFQTTTRSYPQLQEGQFGVLRDKDLTTPQEKLALSLLQRSYSKPDVVHWWVKPYESELEREEAFKNLIAEGAIHLEDEDVG